MSHNKCQSAGAQYRRAPHRDIDPLQWRNDNQSSDDPHHSEQADDDKTRVDPALLACEVATQVFSFLTKKDCMNAMAVSRLWRERVPSLSTAVWSKVELAGFSDALENTSLHRCLGPHVKQVTMMHFHDEDENLEMLRVLQDTNCTRLQVLCFDMCRVVDQDMFLKTMTALTQQLTKLVFLDHDRNLAITPLLDQCPKLTHFTLKTFQRPDPGDINAKEPAVDPCWTVMPDTKFNITYLCLAATLSKKNWMIPILRRCPQLRCLRVGVVDQCYGALTSYSMPPRTFVSDMISEARLGGYSSSLGQDLPLVLRLCPRMQYIDFHSYIDDEPSWVEYDRRSRADKKPGLKLLKLQQIGNYHAEQFVSVIRDHQRTLEHLGIELYPDSAVNRGIWTAGLMNVHFPNLQSFSCSYIHCCSRAITSIIKQSPCLEQVAFMDTGDNIHPAILRELETLDSLRYLSLQYSREQGINYHDGALYDLLKKHADLGVKSTLQTVQLNCCNERILSLIASIQTLRAIHFVDCFNDCTTASLWKFVNAVTKCKNNRVDTLEIGEFRLSTQLLQMIAKMEHLVSVDFCSCIIDKQARSIFLNNARKLKYYRLFDEYGDPQTYGILREDGFAKLDFHHLLH